MASPSQPTTLDLVQRAQGGDGEALNELIGRHLPALRVFIRANTGPMLRARESNSDLVQSVCRDALGDLAGYEWRGEGSFRHWLCRIALNKLANKHDYHAAQKRDPAREDRPGQDQELATLYQTVITPSRHAVAREIVGQMETALDRLPEQYRELILLSRIIGLSHREIGESTGQTEGAVRVQVHRALGRLAAVMRADGVEP